MNTRTRITRTLTIAAFAVVLVSTTTAQAATFFSEDFSGFALPANMSQSGGTAATFNGVNATFPGGRSYLRTSDTDYNTTDFVAEVTVTIQGGLGGNGLTFFGIGEGEPDAGFFGEPRTGSHIYMRPGPDDFGSAAVITTDQSAETNHGANLAGNGTHRLQLSWDSTLSQATFAIDRFYAGGPFVADSTFGPINGADNGFTNLNSRIFFGASNGTTFDDFVVFNPNVTVPEPSTLALAALGLMGLVFRRRCRR